MFFYNEEDTEVSFEQPGESVDPYFYNTSLLLNMDSDFSDSSVNNHTVTVNGNASISTAESKFGGGSGYFDGNGDYIQLPYDSSLDLSGNPDWTFETWIYMPSAIPAAVTDIIGASNGPGGVPKWSLKLNQNTSYAYSPNRLGFFIYDGGPNWINVAYTWQPNTWYHIAVVNSSGTTTMYVDGNSVGTLQKSIPSITGGLQIGSDGETNGFFTGHLDDVRITKGVARYTANFTPPTEPHPTTGPSEIVSTDLQLHLDAGNTNSYPGTGTTWYDLTSNNLDGTLIDGVTYDSADGGSLVFDASLDYVSLPKTITSVDFTVCQFVKHVSNTNFAWLFSQYALDSSDLGRLLIQVEPVASEEKINFYMGGSSVYGNTSISSGQIYYVCCVKDGDNVKIYINGVFDGEGSVPNVAPSNVVCSIGGAPNFNATWRTQTQLIGNIYKTEVYNRALTDAEILQNFHATKDRFGL